MEVEKNLSRSYGPQNISWNLKCKFFKCKFSAVWERYRIHCGKNSLIRNNFIHPNFCLTFYGPSFPTGKSWEDSEFYTKTHLRIFLIFIYLTLRRLLLCKVVLSPKSLILLAKDKKWWRIRDSNPGPADYDSVALTDWANSPQKIIIIQQLCQTIKLLSESTLLFIDFD